MRVIPPPRAAYIAVDQVGVTDAAKTLREYKRYAPAEFDGRSLDASVAELWIDRVERAFEFIECPDRLKVHCGTYSLVDDALYWWRGLFRSISLTMEVTWKVFR